MSSSSIFSSFILFLLFVITPYIQSQPIAPAPKNKPSPVNLSEIFGTGHQFSTFTRLYDTIEVWLQVSGRLNNSGQGMTILAPTDNAFKNLKPRTLKSLKVKQKIQLILYHILPKYYSLSDLILASNPVRTQATGLGGGVFGLNFTGKGEINQVNVSTGVVETRISNILLQKFPQAVYAVDMVLLPEELFGTKTTPTGDPDPKLPSPDADSPAVNEEEPESGGSSVMGTSLGLLGFAWFCCSVVSYLS